MNDDGRAELPSLARLREIFERQSPLAIGIEEELMLLDPETGDLASTAAQVLRRVDGDPRFKRELPATQLEIATTPARTVGEAARQLADARRDLAEATVDLVRPAAAGVHPWASAEGGLSEGAHYEQIASEYRRCARRQRVFALQIHVALGDADRTLAVYNALRSYLPEIAALAANAPFYEGADSGLASVRPKIAELLPRQGVPPALASWEGYLEALRWGVVAGSLPTAAAWWWELRPHIRFGTLELRVPDAQTHVWQAAAVAAFAHSLVAALSDRHAAGEALDVAPTWRIEENRWWAARDGVAGALADLKSGERRPTRDRLLNLLASLEPVAVRLGCEHELADARRLVHRNGALRQRAVAESGGVHGLVAWLVDGWLATN